MWISLCTGAAVVLFTIAMGGNATRKLGRIENEDEWLFTNGFSKIYDACLENQDSEKMTAKLGMSYDKYNRNCRILRYVPDWKKEAGMRIVGILIVLISLVAALLLKNILIGLVGITVFFSLVHIRSIKFQAELKYEENA